MTRKKSASVQIPLVLPLEPSIARADLLESPANQLAVDLVDCWPDWPSNLVVLAGPVGSGKTHLATIWAQFSNAEILPMQEISDRPNIALRHNLVLEDAEQGKIDEEALFHTLNQAKAAGNYVFVTSRSFPSSWMIDLPDLASRLRLAHLVELEEPDDQLLSQLIFKLFSDRQLEVQPKVVDYLVSRMERSMEVAGKVVDWLDTEALARHRKINRAMAADAMAALDVS